MKRHIRFRIPKDKEGVEILDFLSSRFPYFPRPAWKERMERGQVTIDGQPAAPGQILRFRDALEYAAWDIPEPETPLGLGIVYRDAEILVIDKPAGLPCHPGGRYFNSTVWAVLKTVHGVDDPVLVNRLDRETSGLMLVATSAAAGKRCQAQFAGRTVKKEYLALVEGAFPTHLAAHGFITTDPASAVRKRQLFTVMNIKRPDGPAGPDSRWAETEFELVERNGPVSTVRACPRTGRLHQIRATLRAVGFPLVGDKLYGPDPEIFLRFCNSRLSDADRLALRIDRQALHASCLAFRHPRTDRPMEFDAPMPADMLSLLSLLPREPRP